MVVANLLIAALTFGMLPFAVNRRRRRVDACSSSAPAGQGRAGSGRDLSYRLIAFGRELAAHPVEANGDTAVVRNKGQATSKEEDRKSHRGLDLHDTGPKNGAPQVLTRMRTGGGKIRPSS